MIITGHHFQNAYVVHNLEESLNYFRSVADIRTELAFEIEQQMVVRGKRGTVRNKIAFVWVGEMQYELIEPVSGLCDIYREALPQHRKMQFHHVCMRVPDWAKFRSAAEASGVPIVIEGGSEELRFLYLDARETLGHYLEYSWMTDERWRQLGGQ